VEHLESIGQMKNLYKILVRKHEGMNSFGGIGHRWEANIAIELIKTEREGVECINLIQDKENGCNKPSDSIQNMQSFIRRPLFHGIHLIPIYFTMLPVSHII
jgi:hypothetical protein